MHRFFFLRCRILTRNITFGEAWEVKYQQGLSHLEYAVQLYWEQISRGRFFIHEHPATATSWGLPLIRELERHPGVQIVTGDMCRWGMTMKPLQLKPLYIVRRMGGLALVPSPGGLCTQLLNCC